MNCLVSIVMPAYNSGKYIKASIESVLNQTYSNWELLVVDDNSNDNTADIAKSFSENDSRIRYFKFIGNRGATEARNYAIRISRGKYISFLDSDDIWHSSKLEKHVEYMEKNQIYFSYTPYYRFTDDFKKPFALKVSDERYTYKKLLRKCNIGCLTVIYNQEKIGKINVPPLKRRNDYAIWLKALKKVNGEIYSEPLSYYRITPNSLSNIKKYRLIRYYYKVYRYSEKYGRIRSFYYMLRFTLVHVFRKKSLEPINFDVQNNKI